MVMQKERARFDKEIEDVVIEKERLKRENKRLIENTIEDCNQKIETSHGKVRLLEAQLSGLELKSRAQTDEAEVLRRDMEQLSTKHKLAVDKQSDIQSINLKLESEVYVKWI